jgi:hypothetical protein
MGPASHKRKRFFRKISGRQATKVRILPSFMGPASHKSIFSLAFTPIKLGNLKKVSAIGSIGCAKYPVDNL